MQHLVHASVLVHSEIRDELQLAIKQAQTFDPKYASFAATQLHFYGERCQSLTRLLQEWRLWDCDILMRPILECATRFIFVSIAASSERAQRIDEYQVSLSEIEDIQRSEKAKAFIATLPDGDTAMLIGGAVLGAEQESELRARWPKAKRTALKKKWSFSEIAHVLSMFNHSRLDLRKYKTLLHGYGLSSHIIHADQTSMNVVWDRARREPQEREALEQAHFARLATDTVSLLFLCWRAMLYALDVDVPEKRIEESMTVLFNKAGVYQRAFAASQADHYGD